MAGPDLHIFTGISSPGKAVRMAGTEEGEAMFT
jgi:hypothetical protein